MHSLTKNIKQNLYQLYTRFFSMNVIIGAPACFLGSYIYSGDLGIAGNFMTGWIAAMLSYIPETKEKS